MKQALLLIVALSLCATVIADKPMKAYVSPRRVKKVKSPVAPPPLPAPESVLKRQSVRAASVAVPSVTSFPDVLSPNWGQVKLVTVDFEGGRKGKAVEISWPNWPPTDAYSIVVSTNLVKWNTLVTSKATPTPKVLIYDTERVEFYRINKAWVSTPQ